MDHNYEIDKAVVEDNDNECLEDLGEKLDAAKVKLRRAVDHMALDTRLEECFGISLKFFGQKTKIILGIIEGIENEFRSFHQSNLDVTKKRQPMVDALFEKFENSLMTKFGMVAPDEKENLEATP